MNKAMSKTATPTVPRTNMFQKSELRWRSLRRCSRRSGRALVSFLLNEPSTRVSHICQARHYSMGPLRAFEIKEPMIVIGSAKVYA